MKRYILGIRKWLRLDNVMDQAAEWHAFIEGCGDGFIREKSYYKPYDTGSEDENLLEAIRKEHHYYSAGRSCGFAALIVLGATILAGIIMLVAYFT